MLYVVLEDKTLLHIACIYGYDKVVQALLDHVVQVDAQDKVNNIHVKLCSTKEFNEFSLVTKGN